MANEIKQTVVIEAQLSKIQQDLKTLEGNFQSSFSKIEGIAKSAFGAFGIGLGVGSLIAFAKEVAHVAGTLEDLSQKTGVSSQTLSALKPIAEQNSSSIEDFANGITRLIRSLVDSGSAGDKARQKLGELGFSFQQLKQFTADPEKFIGQFAEKLAAIDNPAKRASVAFDVMGKQGANLIPTFLRIAELTKELGGFDKIKIQGIDDATIRSLKQFDDSLNSIKNTLIRFAALPLSEIAKFFRAITGTTSSEDRVGQLNAQLEALQKSAQNQIARLPRAQQETFNTAKPNLAEAPVGLKNTFDQIAALTKQRDAIQGVIDALNKKPGEADIVSDKAVAKATEAAENFSESIEKEIVKLREQNITFFQGADAAKAFAIGQDLALAKQKLLHQLLAEGVGEEPANKAIAQAFSGIDVAELAAKIKLAREQFTGLAEVAAQDPDFLQRIFDTKQADELNDKLKAVITRLGEAQAAAPTGVLLDFNTRAIEGELKKAQDESKAFGEIFGGAFDQAGKDAADLKTEIEKLVRELKLAPTDAKIIAVKAKLDQRTVDQVSDDLKKQIADIQQRGALFGPSEVNVSAEIAQAERAAFAKLQALRTQAGNNAAGALVPRIKGNDIRGIVDELDNAQEESRKLADLLGGAFDAPAAAVDNLTAAIKRLSKGTDEADPALQRLKAQLEDAKAAQRFSEAFEGAAQSFSSFLDDLGGGTKLKDALKNLGNNIRRALNDAFITKPLNDLIKAQSNKIFGDIFPGSKIAKNLPGAGSPVDQAAIAGIQSQITAGTTAIEAAGTAADTAITTTGTTAQTSIETIQAVAIEAIQAAAAAAQADGVARSGSSLFGLFGSTATGSSLGTAQASLGSDPYAGLSAGLAGGFHRGGLITGGLEHATFKRALVMHSGGEIPIIGQSGEFMMNRWSSTQIGKPALDYMNETGKIPPVATISRPSNERSGSIIVNLNGGQNFAERRSVGQITERLGRTVKNASRNM